VGIGSGQQFGSSHDGMHTVPGQHQERFARNIPFTSELYAQVGEFISDKFQIDIMESRGNRKLLDPQGINIGTEQVSQTMHYGQHL